jgi:hypothetical protein
VGHAPSGTFGLLVGARVVFIRNIYLERNMDARYNIYFVMNFYLLKCEVCFIL